MLTENDKRFSDESQYENLYYNNKEGKTNDGSRKDYCQEEESRIY